MDNFQDYSLAILKLMEKGNICISDLAWTLGSGWRDIIANVFHTPERVDQLFRAKFIRISYNRGPLQSKLGAASLAIYLQGWIGARFNWKIKDVEKIEGNIRISYERFTHNTIALLIPEERNDLPPGAITSIEIESENNIEFIFKRMNENNLVKIWLNFSDQCELPSRLLFNQVNQEQMVIDELFRRGCSEHYHNVLKHLSQLEWSNL